MNGAAAWADALRALTLFAADPAGLGGICIRAGAGPVRDRLLVLLYQRLPAEAPVRRVPLHTGDDRVLGGLDLAATLQAGRPVAQKGLLAEADGGIVVLPMAERTEPDAAARLRAVMDDGAVTLQRDGLSQRTATKFGVVALDEGIGPDERLPASLLDRMAFLIDLTSVSLADIVAAPPGPPPDGDGVIDGAEALCHTALALGIQSIRPPLLALRAARIAATLAGRDAVNDADLGLAARLVLGPRATCLPPAQQEDQDEDQPPEADAPDQPSPPTKPVPDRPLQDVVLEAAKAALPPDLLARLQSDGGRSQAHAVGRVGQTKASLRRGRPIGARPGEPRNGARLHLLETLKAAAPWQRLRGRSERFQVRRDDFRIVRFRQHVGSTTVFAVDASGSAAMNRLAEAKGAVELLLADCYVRRDQVALIAFRGEGATLLLSPTGSLPRAKRCLAALPGGGPTPLAAGIEAAMTLASTIVRTGRTPVITLLTDARANIARDGTGGRPRAEAEALEAARSIRSGGVAALMVDTSPRPNPFARLLAEAMGGQYVPLPYADASALSAAIRSAGTRSGATRSGAIRSSAIRSTGR